MAFEPPKHCSVCGGLLAPVEGKPGQRACTAEGCGRIAYLSPVPVVAAIVERNGEIVLGVATPGPRARHGLVTGFLEAEQSPDAPRREAGEGSRRAVTEGRRRPPTPSRTNRNEVIIADHMLANGEIVLDAAELAGYKTVPLEKLRPWDFGTGAAVKDFLALRKLG